MSELINKWGLYRTSDDSTLEIIIREIQKLQEDSNVNYLKIGCLFNKIKLEKLYESEGNSHTFYSWVVLNNFRDVTEVHKYIRLYRLFSEKDNVILKERYKGFTKTHLLAVAAMNIDPDMISDLTLCKLRRTSSKKLSKFAVQIKQKNYTVDDIDEFINNIPSNMVQLNISQKLAKKLSNIDSNLTQAIERLLIDDSSSKYIIEKDQFENIKKETGIQTAKQLIDIIINDKDILDKIMWKGMNL